MKKKQIVTRTQIAKMLGMVAMNFLNSRANYVTKSLGDRAGPQTLRFQLINFPVGSVAAESHRRSCKEKCVYVLGGTGVARIAR